MFIFQTHWQEKEFIMIGLVYSGFTALASDIVTLTKVQMME